MRAALSLPEQAILSEAPPIADAVDAAVEDAVREHSRAALIPMRKLGEERLAVVPHAGSRVPVKAKHRPIRFALAELLGS